MRTVFPWSMSDFKPGEKVCAAHNIKSAFFAARYLRRRANLQDKGAKRALVTCLVSARQTLAMISPTRKTDQPVFEEFSGFRFF